MTARKKIMPETWLEREQPAGFRIGPNGEVDVLTEAEVDALVRRAEAMVTAGFRIRPSKRSLH
jgi:hypothetical protein